MKRNTLFGGLALLAAGAAIGAGSMVTSNAMASTSDPGPTDQLTMVSVGADGEAIECTFEGAEVDGLLPDVPAGAPFGVPVVGNLVVESAEAVPADGDGPSLVISGSAEAPGDLPEHGLVVSGSGPVDANGDPVLPVPSDAPIRVLSADDAREGTADECSALHDQAVEMASQAAAGGAHLESSTGSITKSFESSAVVATTEP